MDRRGPISTDESAHTSRFATQSTRGFDLPAWQSQKGIHYFVSDGRRSCATVTSKRSTPNVILSRSIQLPGKENDQDHRYNCGEPGRRDHRDRQPGPRMGSVRQHHENHSRTFQRLTAESATGAPHHLSQFTRTLAAHVIGDSVTFMFDRSDAARDEGSRWPVGCLWGGRHQISTLRIAGSKVTVELPVCPVTRRTLCTRSSMRGCQATLAVIVSGVKSKVLSLQRKDVKGALSAEEQLWR
jgi:hypothetical protein